jgi:8-oxo-dGTP pyrophosphatase MutT (NUDIX family)
MPGRESVAKILSAGVVIVRRRGAGHRYLLLRAYRNWDFPKGVVEPGEDPLEGAIREVAEETTLTELNFRWGHDYRETAPYGRGKVARYYLAETNDDDVSLPVSPVLGRPEHDEFRWLDHLGARRLLPSRLQPILAWAEQLITKGD